MDTATQNPATPSATPPPSAILQTIALAQLAQRVKDDLDRIYHLVGGSTNATEVAALHERVRALVGRINTAHTTAQEQLGGEVAYNKQVQKRISEGLKVDPPRRTILLMGFASPATPPDMLPATPKEIAEASMKLNDIEAEIAHVLVAGVHTPAIKDGGPLQVKVRAPTDSESMSVYRDSMAKHNMCAFSDAVLARVFSFLQLIDLVRMRRVCRHFIEPARISITDIWCSMAQEPRTLDYVQERLGERARVRDHDWKLPPGAGPGRLGNIFDATLPISMLAKTVTQHVGRIILRHTYSMRAPFITPAKLEELKPGSFQLAEPGRPQSTIDLSLPLCLLRSTCAECCICLSYKVEPRSADFDWLQRMAQCVLDELAAAYVVSWNNEGTHYITLYQIADDIAELKTAIAITDHSWVRLYPGVISGALPAMGRFECIFTLSRMVAAICCKRDLRAEKHPYASMTDPSIKTIEVKLGQVNLSTGMCADTLAKALGVAWSMDGCITPGMHAGDLAKEALDTVFTGCTFEQPMDGHKSPVTEGEPLDADGHNTPTRDATKGKFLDMDALFTALHSLHGIDE